MVALVTGANGFLGSYVVRGLGAAGWEVVGAGRPQMEIPSAEFDQLAVRSAAGLVVHCAGPASVPASLEEPARDLQGSVGVLAGVLDVLRNLDPPPRLLLLSSAAVYGQPLRLPVDEDSEPAPVSPYGFHRMACELLVREYNQLYGVPGVTMRIFSAYGEGLRRQILWDICRKAVEEGRIELSGTGRESRDFVHATDVAEAALAIAQRAAFEGEAYNVASGCETTVAELASLLAAELGVPAESVCFGGERRPGDPLRWHGDISRLEALGFSPRTEIERGAVAYAAWARQEIQVGVQ